MKKIIALFCFVASMQTVFAQGINVDSILQKVAVEKDGDKKFDLLISLIGTEINNNPEWCIQTGLKILNQSKGESSNIEKTVAYSFLGQGYRLLGNSIKALDYHHKAIVTAEKTNNLSLLAFAENQTAHIYRDREEYDKAKSIYLSSVAHADKGHNETIKAWAPSNLGAVYLATNSLDSSLMYSQRAYEIFVRLKIISNNGFVFSNLGGVHSKLGNAQLAVSYFNMAINQNKGSSNIRYLNLLYNGLAEHYQRFNQTDSCAFYAKKAIAAVNNTSFFYLSSKPAKLLTDIYEKTNCDSTLKYAKVLKTANDSLTTSKTNQQILLMTFEEDLRQQEAAAEQIKAEDERKQNIQYALLAIGIIVLLTLYLLLSRSFITNTKLIEFFGVIALLIVFEFLNLLLHPFLERITHHSPVLMLLALVCIAALLVPLHHKVEKWATSKLVEKNKQIRLAAAKKTIEELGKEQEHPLLLNYFNESSWKQIHPPPIHNQHLNVYLD
ncbi:MAG: tetratricopeptide repeat protein [Chitinophagaceae bacterium]|nr:tetratricopeptide repeat protein [Chitinophagaceae bacterium]